MELLSPGQEVCVPQGQDDSGLFAVRGECAVAFQRQPLHECGGCGWFTPACSGALGRRSVGAALL